MFSFFQCLAGLFTNAILPIKLEIPNIMEKNIKKVWFGENLKYLRKKSGATQSFLALFFEKKRSSFSYYDKGDIEPSIEILRGISNLFHITTDALLSVNLSGLDLFIVSIEPKVTQKNFNEWKIKTGNENASMNDAKKYNIEKCIASTYLINSEELRDLELAEGDAVYENKKDSEIEKLKDLLINQVAANVKLQTEIEGLKKNTDVPASGNRNELRNKTPGEKLQKDIFS